MHFTSNVGFRTFLAGAAFATILLAACSGSGSLPNGAGSTGSLSPTSRKQSLTALQVTIGITSQRPNAGKCGKTPGCVVIKPGGSAFGEVRITCDIDRVPVSCGSVTWKVKSIPKGITDSFKPNPGKPSIQTMKAAKAVKIGAYFYRLRPCVTKPRAACLTTPNFLIYLIK